MKLRNGKENDMTVLVGRFLTSVVWVTYYPEHLLKYKPGYSAHRSTQCRAAHSMWVLPWRTAAGAGSCAPWQDPHAVRCSALGTAVSTVTWLVLEQMLWVICHPHHTCEKPTNQYSHIILLAIAQLHVCDTRFLGGGDSNFFL